MKPFSSASVMGLEDFLPAIERAPRFFLATHVNPDGDGIGSLLALSLALKEKGKVVWPYLADELPPIYEFLPGKDLLRYSLPPGEDWVAIVLDCGDAHRLGEEAGAFVERLPEVLVLDHHEVSGTLGTRRYVELTYATGALVYKLLELMRAPISYEIALNLYVAIFSDTGGFRFQQTTAETFALAQRLIEAGVNPAEVAERLTEHYPFSRFCLLKQALLRLKLSAHGRIASSFLTHEDYSNCHASKADSDDFATLFRSIEGVEVSILLKEFNPGEVSVSLRSRGKINVATFAARFGGGGHRFAAGFKLKTDLKALRETLLKELEALAS